MATRVIDNKRDRLTTILIGRASLDEVVQEVGSDNLHVVAAGQLPPNPAELLGTQVFKEFLAEAAEKFDFVILDTPPLGSVIDCAIIANMTDGVLMVVKRKTVDYHQILRVKQQLEKANSRILGVVLNKIGKEDYKTYYKYYNYHTGSNIDKKVKT